MFEPQVLKVAVDSDSSRTVLWLVTEVEACWVATQEGFPKPATRSTLVSIAEPERREPDMLPCNMCLYPSWISARV